MAQSELLVVTGGARAGKSAYATALAEEGIGALLYVATAEAEGDPDLAERIERHRLGRSRRFATIEVPVEVTSAMVSLRGISAAVLDCVGFWLHNMLARGMTDGEIIGRVETFIEVVRAREQRTIVVTSEAGWGPEPAEKIHRQLRNLHGIVNQRLMQGADGVFLMLSGLPLKVKTRQGPRIFAS